MLYDCKRISCWIGRRLTDLAGPDYDAAISFGLPLEPEDSQYGKSRIQSLFHILAQHTVALKCAKSLELPQNGFLRGNHS